MENLIEYAPPEWARNVKNIPSHYIKLGNMNTPIHEWKFSDIPNDFQISLKRDDMTGSGLSGNKIRKLEFLLADAVLQKCECVVTTGFKQSNHCRATAIAACRLGFTTYLLKKVDFDEGFPINGNIFLDRVIGSKEILIPKGPESTILQYRDQLVDVLKEKYGLKPYWIPAGGSNHIGIFGYIEAFREMIDQQVLENFTDIVVTGGSAGTICGITIANYLTGQKLKCHGLSISHPKEYIYEHINNALVECGIEGVNSQDIVDVTDEYIGKGYGKSTDEELDFIMKAIQETGVIFDRTYTGKAIRGLVMEMKRNPKRFKGSKVLFIHTGGIFGIFDEGMDACVAKWNENNPITKWKNLHDIPDDI